MMILSCVLMHPIKPKTMAKDKINIAVLISGQGSNLQALIDACARNDFPACIGLVISNIEGAYGLERAAKAGIDAAVIAHKDYPDKQSFEQALLDRIAGVEPKVDLVCLAGFMRIVSPHFINAWDGRLINIHPSLLPAYKGVNTHARALADGVAEAGCSVHYVTPELDSGEIIVQRAVAVLEGDTEETLAARVLGQEHIAYPEAVERLASALLNS